MTTTTLERAIPEVASIPGAPAPELARGHGKRDAHNGSATCNTLAAGHRRSDAQHSYASGNTLGLAHVLVDAQIQHGGAKQLPGDQTAPDTRCVPVAGTPCAPEGAAR